VISRVYKEQLENVKRAIEIGGIVALGSDAGAYSVNHASGLLDEIAHFEEIGLDKVEIEKMSLENGAKALKLVLADILH